MTKKIEQQTREQVAEFLPRAIRKALGSYEAFRENKPELNPKDFKAHHEACKAVIAHVQLLIKLAEWAHLPDEKTGDETSQAELANMIQSAQFELGKKEI